MIRKIIRPLLQEIYQNDDWKMLVCCMLLNQTNRKQVDTIRYKLFNVYPTAKHMMKAKTEILVEILRPLGLYNRRAKSLIKMSEGYVKGLPVDKLYGIGRYALDSWEIFQCGNHNVQPTDLVLQEYLRQENNFIDT